MPYNLPPFRRRDFLGSSGAIARALILATWVAVLWALFFPHPRALVLGLLGASPWVAIVLCRRYGHSFTLAMDKPDKFAAQDDLSLLMLLPGAALALRALFDVKLAEWTSLLIPAIIGGLLMAACAAWAAPILRERLPNLLVAFFVMALYAGGGIALLDTGMDAAQPTELEVQVLAKHQTRGKSGYSDYLTLMPWGPRTEPADVRVSCELYRGIEAGQSVSIHLYPGWVGLPWYRVGDAQGC